MYGNKSIKKRKDGSNYKDFYYYGCKHRNMTRGHKCDYKKQVHEEMLDASVAEVISKLVSNPKFSDLIRNKINMEVDTSALDQEIENYKIQLRKLYHNKDTILSDMDSLDYEDKHYQRRKTDLENHLYKTYDKIDAKYYEHSMQVQFNKHTLHSANLYQIFTYVKNKEYELREKEHTVSGMLLYAKTDEEIYPNNVYQMSGNQITVRTLDLNLPFTEIAEQLDTIAKLHFSL